MTNLGMFILILFLVLDGRALSQTFQWERSYDGANFNDIILEIDDDDQGNIYGVGYTNTPFGDWLIVKYNSSGVEQWVRTVNGAANNEDRALAVVCPSPNEIYVTGYVSGLTTGFDMLVVKYDSNGVEQWQHTGGGTIFGEQGLDIKVDPNGFIYATKWWSEAAGANHHYLIKYDQNGNVLWERMGNIAMSSITHTVATLGNGDVYIGGTNFYVGEIIAERYDGAGTLMWSSSLPSDANSDASTAMGVDANGNVYVGGSSYDTVSNKRTWMIVKFGDNGAILWTRRYAGTSVGGAGDFINDMYVDPSGDIYVTGYIENSNTGSDYFTVKLSEDGTEQWSHLYIRNSSGGGSDQGKKCWLSIFGDLYVLGRAEGNALLVRYDAATGDTVLVELYDNVSFGTESDIISDQFGNIWFSGTNYNGFNNDAAIAKYLQVPTSVEPESQGVPGEFALMQNYPNPFNPSTTIRYTLSEQAHVTLRIYNTLGQEVATLVDEMQEAGDWKQEWDARGQTSGVYFYRVTTTNFVQTRKLVLLR